MIRKYILCILLSLAVPTLAFAQSIDERSRFDSMINKALTSARKTRQSTQDPLAELCLSKPQASALPILWAAARLKNTVAPQVYIDAFERVAKAIKHPTAKRFAMWQALRARTEAGQNQSKELTKLGLVTQWYLAGPFENSAMEGLQRVDEPQKAFSLDTPLQGVFANLHWLPYDAAPYAGAINLSHRIAPATNAVSFLVANISVKAEQSALLQIASATPFKAWLNAQFVAQQNDFMAYPTAPEANAFLVKLQKGDNQIVVKVGTEDSLSPIYVSLLQCSSKNQNNKLPDTNKCSLQPLVFSPSSTLTPLTKELQNDVPVQAIPSCATALLSAQIPLAHKALLAYLSFSENNQGSSIEYATQALSTASTQNQNEDNNALRVTDPCSEDFILAADLLDEDWEVLEAYKSTENQCSKHPWIKSRYLELRLAQNKPIANPELLQIVKQLQRDFPKAYTPALLHASILSSVGLELLAAKELAPYVDSQMQSPNFASAYASLHSNNNENEYQRALSALLAQDLGSSIYLNQWLNGQILHLALLNLEDRQAKVQEIILQFQQSISANPYDTDLRLSYARTMQAYDYPDDLVHAQYKKLIEISPTNPELWLAYADYLQERGQKNDAILAINNAVQFSPHDATLRQRLQFYSSSDEAFENAYVINQIPENKNPNATGYVSLLDQRISKIYPNGLYSTFYQIAFQIIGFDGIRSLRIVPINYSPTDENIEIIYVTVTKKDGSVRRNYRISESNIADEAIRMYYDQRQIQIQFDDLSVGDKIEFRYKRSQNKRSSNAKLFFSDLFQLQSVFHKQWNRYVVLAPKTMPLHFKKHDPFNTNTPTQIQQTQIDPDNIEYIFEEKEFPAIQQEPLNLGPAQLSQFLIISSFNTWQEITNWYISLSQEQWRADPEITNLVQNLTKDLTEPLDKVRAIHHFVVTNTRYVALEFGIHGYKPYPANLVLKRRFGDCKDKASLLKAMLNAANIRADFVLIRTRPNGAISTDIATPYLFDHAITYLPDYQLFLDGTAENSGMYETPYQDQGALALIVSDDLKYTLLTTPISNAEQNKATGKTSFFIGPQNTEFQGSATYSGLMAPSYRARYQINTQQQQLYQNELVVSYPGSTLKSVKFHHIDDINQPVSLEFSASVPTKDLSNSKNSLAVLPLASSSSFTSQFPPSASRIYAIAIPTPMTFSLQTTLHFPPNKRIIAPQNQSKSTAFGLYNVSFAVQNNDHTIDSAGKSTEVNSITTTLLFQLHTTVVQPKDYPDFLAFLQSFDRVLNTPIIAE